MPEYWHIARLLSTEAFPISSLKPLFFNDKTKPQAIWLGFCIFNKVRKNTLVGVSSGRRMVPQGQNAGETVHPAVLICEGDEVERDRIFSLLSDEYQISATSEIGDALLEVQRGAFHVILLSFDRRDSSPGLNVTQPISILQKIDPDLMVIIMATEENFGEGDSLELEREIRSKGIFYYMLKPVEESELKKVLGEAIRCSKRARSTH